MRTLISTIAILIIVFYTWYSLVKFADHVALKINRRKENKEWLPGKDLHWTIVAMCEKIEDYSLTQIIEAAEMRITDPDLVVQLEDFEPEQPYKVPMVQDRYGHPAIGHDVVGTCMYDGCDRRDSHTHEW